MSKTKKNSKIILGCVKLKRVLIYLIRKYQEIPFRSHHNCKYIPTCSNYAITVLEDFGAIKGSYLTIKRILKCNPFSKGGIDLPPKRERV